ncbi:MAG: putative sulfate exporter family transporter, partial [Pirellula sp.]
QNILIGVIAFAVAVYWVSFVEKREDNKKPSAYEIWRRFPKFTLGFLAVSLLLSYCQSLGIEGKAMVSSIVDGATKSIREWMFCLAFVSIGLESNFREYGKMLASGKPVILYLCGQALNLLLTFLMAWLMFSIVFPNAASELLGK